ncbi:MAG: hypothetical protein Q8O38_13490 [Sulfurimicrobium sp.]|nr:hypothetical protein [Sulfurimicrobium sp.]
MVVSDLAAKEAPQIFEVIQLADPTLDRFAMAILGGSFDSNKGRIYCIPESEVRLTAFCSFESILAHAKERLDDASVTYPVRAAWSSLVDRKARYGEDGSYTGL